MSNNTKLGFCITKGLARYTAADESANIPSAPLKG